MDFSAKTLKDFVSEVGTVFTRAKQYAEETIGTAEKTELDLQFESLADRSDKTKLWTERIVSKTEAVLHPNPNTRYGDMIFEKIGSESKKEKERTRNLELLGCDMIDAGIEFSPSSVYGSTLIKIGKSEQKLGQTEREFVGTAYRCFVQPLKKFLDEDMRTITKERKILETKRLDLDAAKNRLRKAKSMEAQTNAEEELKTSQDDFDRQVEISKLLLEGISSAHANHVRCLNEFVRGQIAYYADCHQIMCELQRELANNSTSTGSIHTIRSQLNDMTLQSDNKNVTKRRAKALYDYEAHDSSELSLAANEVIMITQSTDLEAEWMIGEKEGQSGKVPLAYLEILNN